MRIHTSIHVLFCDYSCKRRESLASLARRRFTIIFSTIISRKRSSYCWIINNYWMRLSKTSWFVSGEQINYSQLPPCGHLAITDSSKIPGESYRRLTEINSRYYGLSLLRTYGHFIRSQRHNFIVFSLVIADTEQHQVYFFCFLRLSLSFLTPRQNAMRMSTKFNIRSAFYFRSSI